MYGFTIMVDGNSVQQMKQIEAELQKMGVVATIETNKVQGSFQKLASGLSGFGAMLGVALGGAAITAFGSKIIEAGTKVEDTLIGLTTSLRDAGAAQEVINKTMEDAEKTPFDFSVLMDANRALISTGMSAEKSRTDILNLANAIAAAGKGNDELNRMAFNMQQIKNNGVATAQDVKQFGIAGVSIYNILAASMHKNVNEIKGMEISYEQLSQALAKAAGKGGLYEDALKNMSEKSTSVKISNLGDSVFKLSVTMFNDLKPAIEKCINALSGMVKKMADAWDWMVKNRVILQDVATGLAIATAAFMAYWVVINEAVIVTRVITAVTWLWNAALAANPIGIVIVVIGLLIAGIIQAYRTFGEFRGYLLGTWETMKEFGRVVADIFGGIYKVIHGALTFDGKELTSGLTQTTKTFEEAGARMKEAFVKGYNGGMASFAADQKAQITTGQKGSTIKNGATNAVTQSAINTSALSGGKGGLGESKVINIRIDTMQKVEVKDGKGLEQHSQNAIEILTRTLNNLAYSQSSSM